MQAIQEEEERLTLLGLIYQNLVPEHAVRHTALLERNPQEDGLVLGAYLALVNMVKQNMPTASTTMALMLAPSMD